MTQHAPALCDRLACSLCDTCGEGYVAGKNEAHFELRLWEPGDHAPGCGCDPCQTIRIVVAAQGRGCHAAKPG